eukprot:9275276-Alexandrium_andersonii.AAC.1
MPAVGLTWSTQKEGRMGSRSDRLDPAAGDWYRNERKPWEKNLLRSREDGNPSVYNMVKVAPLLIETSAQRKDKAKQGTESQLRRGVLQDGCRGNRLCRAGGEERHPR